MGYALYWPDLTTNQIGRRMNKQTTNKPALKGLEAQRALTTPRSSSATDRGEKSVARAGSYSPRTHLAVITPRSKKNLI